ncbi:hypothetical protein [Anaeromicropila herbilytica]|uniref:Uncharacterized protein n=1 Tax=Anaeromicropila herbilytica TaxID=2785025 RepID=A0A7R7EL93_9FIRM|nr:hypothetical protein [Anaeromicropila herbilytica]BCN30864.1 hypothetical protein bsdtb5_21590 [Anaeromicropila herbilytica]
MKVIKHNIIFLALLILTLFFIKIEFFPFGYVKEEALPNTSIYYYKVDTKIKNKNDFINYLKANNKKYELGSFMNNKNKVNWKKVLKSTHIYFIGWKKVYSIHYRTLELQCNGYKLDMTSDGYIKDYRSAGK